VTSASGSSATRASIAPTSTEPAGVPLVTKVTDVPNTGELTEVASAPLSSSHSTTPLLPLLAVGLAAVLVVGTGVSTAFTAHARRRHGQRA
jgi:cobalamin biosynthesis Mg chelatase CobN